jgi:hypothetical protein
VSNEHATVAHLDGELALIAWQVRQDQCCPTAASSPTDWPDRPAPRWARLLRLVRWLADRPGLAPHPDDAVWAPLRHYPSGPPQR